MSVLRQRMIDEMQLRNFSPRTQRCYLGYVVGLVKHFGLSPDQLQAEQVRQYLLFLSNERQLSSSTVNGVRAALRLLYGSVLQRPNMILAIPPRRTPRPLPEVLSAEEVSALFALTPDSKERALLMTAYATGLRVSELACLQTTHIDSQRRMIHVVSGKGQRDRYSLLSLRLLAELRDYWRQCRAAHPSPWLFTADHDPQRPINPGCIAKIMTRAKDRAGIRKKGNIHLLRHSFATHLLEAGVELPVIQILMGHRSIRTTARYLHLTRKTFDATNSPLDLLDLAYARTKEVQS